MISMNVHVKSVIKDSCIRLNGLNFSLKNYDARDTIILTGTPRSGTTWIAEVLSSSPGYTLIFEPFHPGWFPESAHVGFQPRTYLPPEKEWPAGEAYIRKILTGKTITNRFHGVDNLMNSFLSRKLIIKFVRANRLLPWMANRFNVKLIVLMLRHPCAVIHSQMESGYYGYNRIEDGTDFFPEKEKVLSEAGEIGCIDPAIIKELEKISSREEILAAVWGLDNYIPLHSPWKDSWVLLPYESIIDGGGLALKQFFDMSGLELSRKYEKQFRKPSKVVSVSFSSGRKNQLSKWKKALTKKQIYRILDIANLFGLDFYNDQPEIISDRFCNFESRMNRLNRLDIQP